jgi:hypothetical protein
MEARMGIFLLVCLIALLGGMIQLALYLSVKAGNVITNPKDAPNWWPFRSRNIIVLASLIAYLSLPVLLFFIVETFTYLGNDFFVLVLGSYFVIFPLIVIVYYMYKLRSHNPLIYGVIELCVAANAVYFAVGQQTGNIAVKGLGISAALYIAVRGLDNIDKGLPPFFRKSWDKTFPKGTNIENTASSEADGGGPCGGEVSGTSTPS